MCSPALNPEYELFQPNEETVLAHIRNMYDGLFVKPPVFIKSIIDHLTDDISSKKTTFELDPDLYERYLKNMYFEKMSEAMFQKVFKTIWKFVFISTDPECTEHRGINMLMLVYMIKYNKPAIIAEFQHNIAFYQNITEEDQKKRLLTFIIKCPEIVDYLPEILKQQAVALKSVINTDTLNIHALTWFSHKGLHEYADDLIVQINKYPHMTIHANVLSHIKKLCIAKIMPEIYCCIACAYCGKSRSYDTADKRVAEAILPALDVFSEASFKQLLEVFGSNNQIYGRGRSIQDDKIIAERILEINPNFDFSPYPKFNVADDSEE